MLGLPQDVTLSGISIPAVREAMEEPLPPGPALRFALEDMSAKRRTEFAAGRICAARSLRKLGVIAEFPLPVRDRLPVWPSGVLGSISHCATMAVAMTAMKSRYCALGVDVESLIDPGVALEIQPSVCRDGEWIGLENHVPCRARSVTLLFSAKEALYKALYPLTGRFEDFHAAEFCGCEAGALVLRLTHDWTSCWRAGTRIRVRYAWLDRMVVSAAFIPGKP
ncbi:4'-phosphopantetheinyl transferase family protein [Pseudothauera nasutitermitis]|nr:4'-phosphopantetheinyl transferase superfamily protein [Pseudothauera nasutitermitis]